MLYMCIDIHAYFSVRHKESMYSMHAGMYVCKHACVCMNCVACHDQHETVNKHTYPVAAPKIPNEHWLGNHQFEVCITFGQTNIDTIPMPLVLYSHLPLGRWTCRYKVFLHIWGVHQGTRLWPPHSDWSSAILFQLRTDSLIISCMFGGVHKRRTIQPSSVAMSNHYLGSTIYYYTNNTLL